MVDPNRGRGRSGFGPGQRALPISPTTTQILHITAPFRAIQRNVVSKSSSISELGGNGSLHHLGHCCTIWGSR